MQKFAVLRFLDISPGWVAMMCMLYLLNPMGCFLPFCAAFILHELGHLFALALLRIPVRRLRLNLGGAVLETDGMSYGSECLCALAGPLCNLLCVSLGVWFPMFALLSLCLAVFNLLPIAPLDGGRAICALLSLRFAPCKVRRIMQVFSLACVLLLAALSLWVSIGLGGGIWAMLLAALTALRVGLSVLEDEKYSL